MSSIAALQADPIGSGDGIPSGYLDWRFVIQIAGVQSGTVLGSMVLGDPLSGKDWVDVTADAHGIHIDRGAPPTSRPGSGQLDFWLNNDAGGYSEQVTRFNGPGYLVRVSLGAPGTVCPIFTGYTVSWNSSTDGIASTRTVAVTAIETLFLLAEVDDPAVAATGGGELAISRLGNIISRASWQFGLSYTAAAPLTTWTMQATTYAQDLLTELLLTADSLSLVVRPGKTGAVAVKPKAGAAMSTPLAWVGAAHGAITDPVPVVADSIRTANDDERIVGTAYVARTGGTAVTYTKSGVQGRYQKRSRQRFDLNTQNPGGDADLAAYAASVLFADTFRVESFELDSNHGGKVFEFIAAADLGRVFSIAKADSADEASGVLFVDYIVCGISLDIEPVHATEIHIAAQIQTDLTATSSWSAYP